MVLGDFNCTLDPNMDSTNSQSACHKAGRAELSQFMLQRGLQDIWRTHHRTVRQYTGPSRDGQHGRLDMILADDNLGPLLVEAEIWPHSGPQQHAPVLAVLANPKGAQRSKKAAPWRLNPDSLKNGELVAHLLELGQRLLGETAHISDPGSRLERVRNRLIAETKRAEKGFAEDRAEQGKTDRKRLSVLYKRQRLVGDPNAGFQEIQTIRLRILAAKAKDNDRKLMKYRVEERTDADRPTKGFLRAAQAKALRTNIPALKRPNSTVRVTSLHGMAEIARVSWVNVSRAPETGNSKLPVHKGDREFFLNHIKPCVSPKAAELLGAPIRVEEFEPVFDKHGRLLDPGILKSLPSCRSPGEDGVPYEWYKALWPVMGSLLVKAWNQSRDSVGGMLAASSRSALIHLIYKGSGDPEDISNYRPIALLAAEYKLLARCMARRLLPLMESLIHPDQTYGMSSRSIEQNIRVKADLLQWCDKLGDADFLPSGVAEGGVGIIDVDMRKAFDSVDIDFLIDACGRFGLGNDFCRWISLFYRGSSAKVMLNGHICEPYSLACGIRQGCPISPLLFTLVVEALALAVRADPAITGIPLDGGPGWPRWDLRLQQYADDLSLYFLGMASAPRLMELLASFGRATNLVTNQSKTYGLWYGPGVPCLVPALANVSWLKEGEPRTSLGIAVGKRLDPFYQSAPLEDRVMRALKHLRGLSSTIYNRAVLAQVKVVSIVVFYARVSAIAPECIKRMQKAIDDYIWLSNAPESIRQADAGRPVQRHVCATAVYAPLPEGGLPVQRLEHVIAANQAWAVRKWISPKTSVEKYLPRKWIADANWPRRIGFNAVFAPDPQVPSCAPVFYHHAIRAWRMLDLVPVPLERREQLDSIPLWDNPRVLPLSSGMLDSNALARSGLCYVGQVLPWDSLSVPYTRPSDPEGVRGPPCAVPRVLPRGWVTRLREDLKLPISQLTSSSIPALQSHSAFVSYLPTPTGGWPPRRAPDNITRIWAAPPPGARMAASPLSGTAAGEPATSPRIFEPHVVISALRTLPLDPFGAGDTDEALFQLPSGPSLEECGVRDMYHQLSTAWRVRKCGKKKNMAGNGLRRHLLWVSSSGNGKDSWYKTVFLSIRSRLLSSEERSLLWQIMHSDGRFGYRVRSEQLSDTPGEADCPFCGPDRALPATDPGETMEHAYGTCPGLDEIWVWAAETFLLPAGGIFAAKTWTSAIHDQDKDRRPLVTGVGPHILAGLLGVVKARNADHLQPKERKDLAQNLNAWWSLIRASILVVLEAQRQNARRGIHKYKVPTVARPPTHITKECVLQRLRARVTEEALRVPEPHVLQDGILFAGVLGHVRGEYIALSAALGSASISRLSSTKPIVRVPPRRGPTADWRCPSPPPDGALHAYLFFDGASRNNPGPAAGGCVLKASNGIDTLVQDSEFLGKKTNNEAEICGLILGLHRARAAGITALSIRGDSQLIIDHITGRARCTTRCLSPLLDRALRLMDPQHFPHGIDVQWVRRNCNAEADAAANAGLRARKHDRRILFYDD